MKIAVLGASGRLGREIVTEATQRGHEVVSVSSRRGGGDVTLQLSDTKGIQELAESVDAVVVSVPPSRTGQSHQPWIEANADLAASALAARLFVVGGAGSTLAGGKPLMDSPGFPEAYKAEAESATKVLEIFRAPATRADWTILSPAPEIAPGRRTGRYQVSEDDVVGDSISTQDFAVAVLDELERPAHRGTRFVVAN